MPNSLLDRRRVVVKVKHCLCGDSSAEHGATLRQGALQRALAAGSWPLLLRSNAAGLAAC